MSEAAITRARLAEQVSHTSKITGRDADLIVEAVFDAIAGALRAGEEVEIRGFGSFRLRDRKARRTRNPRTGEAVMVPPKRVPFFRAGKSLRERLNRGEPEPRPGPSGADGGGTGPRGEEDSTPETPSPADADGRAAAPQA